MTLETGLKFCHNFMVVIDTNRFNNYSSNELIPFYACDKCHSFFADKNARAGITLGEYYITEGVFGEIIQQRKEEFLKTKNELEKNLKKLNLKLDLPSEPNFTQELKDYLDKYSIQILPHVKNEVLPRIIDRAINKNLPFKSVSEGKNNKGSDKGFKDVLIWESLLEFNYEEKRIGKVFLITANNKDFPQNELLPEWNQYHPNIELSIIENWDNFIIEEREITSEIVVQNNLYYPVLLEMFQNENSDIVELPNYKKRITKRKNSPVVEIETDVKKVDGTIYTEKYYYDLRVNEPTLIDPDEYDKNEECND